LGRSENNLQYHYNIEKPFSTTPHPGYGKVKNPLTCDVLHLFPGIPLQRAVVI